MIILKCYTHSNPGDAVSLNAEQWLSILIVADKYVMTPLRDTAVRKLLVAFPRLDPVKQIAIARKYNCDELVKEPFETLVTRKEVLSRMEMAQLPLGDLYEITVSREEALRREIAKAANPPRPVRL